MNAGPSAPTTPLPVLYIGGTGRTGSTILANILAQYDECFSGGELAYLWRFGLDDDGLCGCGELLRRCPVWMAIFESAYGGLDRVDGAEMVRLRRRFDSRYLPLMVHRGLSDRLLRRAGEFPATVERLYHGIREATGRPVVVDTSKEPHYSAILRSRPSLDVHFLHLVRDARSVAASWRPKNAERGLRRPDAHMEQRGSLVASAYFDVSNVAAELMWSRRRDRYLFLRYEDFLARPTETIRQIGRFVGLELEPERVLRDGILHLGATHTAWGNPNRMDSGEIPLARADRWPPRLTVAQRSAVTALTAPLLAHYGYPLRSSRRDAAG